MIPVLMYHKIEPKKRDLYTVLLSDFKKQISWLYEEGYRAVLPKDIFCEKLDKKVIITFDDGDISNYLYAYPLLSKYKFKCVFFVIADSVGTSSKMNWKMLSEVSKDGVEIGSHSLTHQILTKLPPDKIEYELRRSKELIEEKINRSVELLSLPGGFYNQEVIKIAKEAGYKMIFTSDIGYDQWKGRSFLLKRFVIRGDYTLEEFKKIIEGNFCFFLCKKIEQKICRIVKNIFGIASYNWLKKRLIEKNA